MLQIKAFTFNDFQENTYILYDETKECIIIDPGCNTSAERDMLADFISNKKLIPVRLLNTHCHLDHVFGNAFVAEKYNLGLEIHAKDLPMLQNYQFVCTRWGVMLDEISGKQPTPTRFMEDGETINFGKDNTLEVIFVPGHSPGSVAFFCKQQAFMISGDVLFHGSIGRTDLPGGNHATLIESIKTRILPLGDAVTVYSGHGMKTSVGFEQRNNPFLQ
jgi:hydroxyacylglutathione hydrolase